GLAMSRKLAEILHVQRGDTIAVKMIKGERRTHPVEVVEISDGYLGTVVYADIHYLSRLIGEELAISGVQLATDRDPTHTESLYRALKKMPALQAVDARLDMIKMIETTLLQNMWVFIGMLVMFAGIVFFGSILNSSLVNLAERQREIATLRVLGYGPWMVGGLLLRESLVVTLLGTVLGMPIGYGLATLTSMAYDTEMFRFPVISTPSTWIWTVALAVVFAMIAHLAVQRSINKMDWLEALQAKE
ncbi:MAG TPA: ABC transporter permease, partial [Thermoguttaceae bacterium]|nr:ABC transporter permease [Thermoguttaceae bacterium]